MLHAKFERSSTLCCSEQRDHCPTPLTMSLEIFDGAEEIAQQAALRSPAKSGVTVPRKVRSAIPHRRASNSRLSVGGAQPDDAHATSNVLTRAGFVPKGR